MCISLHLQKDVQLNKNEYNNFQKLRYFGLIEKDKNHSGNWKMTEQGLDFISGRLLIPTWVKTFRNKIIEKDTSGCFIQELNTSAGYLGYEYWQKEFPYQIKMSKILPIEDQLVQSSLL